MAENKEIHALIQLLDDEDNEVFKHVHDKLISLGSEIIPELEQAWVAELNPLAHERLETIIHKIQFDALEQEWEDWLFLEPPDLLTGAFLVAKYHYPDIRFEDIQKKLQKIKQSIWLELNYNQTPLEQIQIFNQVFYNYHNFKGSQTSSDYQDFCINNVLETKKGNSIIVGIIYQVLAQELNLPVYGVTLVRHYILAFCKKAVIDFYSEENLEREIMFYINPINRGSIFSRNEIKDYLDKMKVEQDAKNFIPATNNAIIKELITYLIEIYQSQNREDRVKELRRLYQLL
ncbi:MAG: transglutaminase family protein [Chitinophagales bacterium]|nr:transglutaminase family protein [Chitinophagales bacterium]